MNASPPCKQSFSSIDTLFWFINDKLISSFNVVGLLFYWTDASSATDVKCEINSSFCPPGCQYANPITVDPDSKITRNCSIITRGLELGMTWRQAKKKFQNSTGSPDLVLLQLNSTKESDTMSCDCTNIHFTCRCYFACFYLSFQYLNKVFESSASMFAMNDQLKGLKCKWRSA